MAKLTWSIETAAGNITKDSPILSDANMQRFLDWIWFAYPQMEADGVTPKARTPANEAAAWRDWVDFQWLFNKDRVLDYERSEAARVAREGIADL